MKNYFIRIYLNIFQNYLKFFEENIESEESTVEIDSFLKNTTNGILNLRFEEF